MLGALDDPEPDSSDLENSRSRLRRSQRNKPLSQNQVRRHRVKTSARNVNAPVEVDVRNGFHGNEGKMLKRGERVLNSLS